MTLKTKCVASSLAVVLALTFFCLAPRSAFGQCPGLFASPRWICSPVEALDNTSMPASAAIAAREGWNGVAPSPSVNPAQGNRRRKPTQDLSRSGGTVISLIDIYPYPLSLDDLINRADLIIRAHTDSLLGSRYNGPKYAASLETDFEFSVQEVLKGPEDVKSVVVSQTGGSLDGIENVAPQDPLMQVGGDYVLFLTRDNRPDLPSYNHSPRYVATGAWNGKFRITDDQVNASERSPVSLKAFGGKTVGECLRVIRSSLSNRPNPDK